MHYQFIVGDAPSGILANIKDWSSVLQSIVTSVGIVVAGCWAFIKYGRQGERNPQIATSAEIIFHSEQDDHWIVELRAVLENKGKVEHRFKDLAFDLSALMKGGKVDTSEKWGNQVDFPVEIAKGNFRPAQYSHFVLGPSITGKYSYLTKVSKEASVIILHCWFSYMDRADTAHSMEATARVPRDLSEVLPKSTAPSAPKS